MHSCTATCGGGDGDTGGADTGGAGGDDGDAGASSNTTSNTTDTSTSDNRNPIRSDRIEGRINPVITRKFWCPN